jgi:crotonobetainyl-CoA:carnitine CoA-transferase CaiB-like acyl-CoA transferase
VAQIADNKADVAAGMHGAIAVLAALVRRGVTGRGERIEVPLFDALLATYSETAYALLPEPEPREESRLFDAGPNGHVAIAGTAQNAWARFRRHFAVSIPRGDARPRDLRHAAIEA